MEIFIQYLLLDVRFIIFNKSDASIKYDDVKTNSRGFYSISISSYMKIKKFILQVYSIEYYSQTAFNITPYFYAFSILYQDNTNSSMTVAIKAYTRNIENNYLEPVNHEVNIRIFYILINA